MLVRLERRPLLWYHLRLSERFVPRNRKPATEASTVSSDVTIVLRRSDASGAAEIIVTASAKAARAMTSRAISPRVRPRAPRGSRMSANNFSGSAPEYLPSLIPAVTVSLHLDARLASTATAPTPRSVTAATITPMNHKAPPPETFTKGAGVGVGVTVGDGVGDGVIAGVADELGFPAAHAAEEERAMRISDITPTAKALKQRLRHTIMMCPPSLFHGAEPAPLSRHVTPNLARLARSELFFY